ncbi:hypothetical protein [Nannocystis bainbridge]|uniref:Uncharacterized protein n=1 Tax=Nannocystis bainbridge TaxID=2995303 RepID=A0ABT5E8H5_9BACT|nr:hypothetical protein [Nannocystis bainbridge]MDC0721715.1 hypothetical protein [Nannocystis bainbridge]
MAGERLAITVDESTTAVGMNHSEEQVQCFRFAWPAGGQVHFCGAPGDEARWHAAYVGDGGQAVTPLAVGALADVKATWARVRDAVDPRQLSRPVVRFGDVRRHFKPTYGRFLVGVAQEGSSTILLAVLGQQLAVVLVEGKRRVVLDIKAPLDLREVFVDRMRGLRRGAAPRGAKPPRELDQARVSSATRARYIGIVHGLPIDVVDGPSIPDVVWRCFKGLEHRAKALRSVPVGRRLEQDGQAAQELCRPRRLKGKKYLRRLLRALFQCSLRGSDDLVGLTGVLRDEIQRHDPSFVITLEALADTLNLLRATGTCLVTRADGERLWHIHLVGLNDPSSVLHRRLLEETPIPFRFPASATGEVLAEDDETTPTADLTAPSSSSWGETKGSSPHEEPKVGIDDAGRTSQQAAHAREPAAHDADELAREEVGAAAATSATTSTAEAGVPAGAVGSSTESADAARDEPMTDSMETSGAVAAGDAACPSEDDAASAARLASSPLAPLLTVAVMLGAWESRSARDHVEVIAVREWLVAVLRDVVHLQARGVVQPMREGPVERPPERGDGAEEAGSAGSVRDGRDRILVDAPRDRPA